MRNLTIIFIFALFLFITQITSTFAVDTAGSVPMSLFELESQAQFSLQDRGSHGMTIDIELPSATRVIEFRREFGSLMETLTANDAQNSPLPFISQWVVIPAGYRAEGQVTRNFGRRISVGQSTHSPVYLDQAEVQATTISDANNESTSVVSLGTIVTYRGINMAPVIVKPLQLSNDSDIIFESTSITYELEFTSDNSQYSFSRNPIRGEFARVMDRYILNPPARDLAASDLGKMVIMYPELFEEVEGQPTAEIEEFANWKRLLGFDVSTIEVDAWGENASEEIKDELNDLYNEGLLDYLIIIGDYFLDHDRLGMGQDTLNFYFPTYTAEEDTFDYAGDQYFVTFDGDDDILPDVIVGRFMCRDTESLAYAFQRSIKYERDPEAGEWLTKALYSLGSTPDPLTIAQPALDMMHWSLPRLTEIGFESVDTLAWGDENHHMHDIREAYSEGAALGFGDGALFGLAGGVLVDEEIEFHFAEAGNKNPFIIANMVYYTDPQTVTFFNQGTEEEPNGMVAGFGLWDPVAINHNTTYILGWSVYGMRYHDIYQGGSLFQFAGIQYQQIHDLKRLNSDQRLVASGQMQYLGDPTIYIRTGSSTELSVGHPAEYNVGATAIALQVTNGDGQPVSRATVCINQIDNFKYVSSTDGNGNVSFTVLESLAEGELNIVANGHNLHALREIVEVTVPNKNIILESFDIDDSDNEENADGLFRNGETVFLDLSLANAGEDDADDLTATFSSDSEFLSFSAEQVAIDNIAAGETGTLVDRIEMTLTNNCPGRQKIQVMIEVTSGELEWLISFEIVSSGPAYEYVGQEELRFNFIGNQSIRPQLQNLGDLASSQIGSILSTQNPYITMLQDEKDYPAIEADATEMPDRPFTFRMDELFIPGHSIDFVLTLRDGDDDTVVPFTVGPFGETTEDDPVGPDSYGYMAFDSGDEDEAQAPEYHWREINRDAEGDEIYHGKRLEVVAYIDTLGWNDSTNAWDIYRLNTWDESVLVPLPFEFQYYGTSYDSLVINTNGWIALGSDAINNRTPIPWGVSGIGAPNSQICPYVLDLFNDNNNIIFNGIFYHYLEDEEIFIIEWSALEVRNNLDEYYLEFQILLYNSEFHQTPTNDGEIVFQYRTAELITGPDDPHFFPTIGIRSPDGTDGLQYSFNEGYSPGAREIDDEFAIKFTTNRSKLIGAVRGSVVRADNGEILAGAVIKPNWLFSFVTDEQGVFQLDNLVTGLYPFTVDHPNFSTLIDTFEVVEGDVVQLDPFAMAFPMPTVDDDNRSIHKSLRPDGSMTRADFNLENNGQGELEYDVALRYADGSAADFRVLEKLDIITLTQGPNIEDARIRGYSPLYTDSLLFIPISSRDDGFFIAKIDLIGDDEIINFRMPIPDEDRQGFIESLAWDGQKLWGGYSTIRDGNLLLGFAANDDEAASDTIRLKAPNANDNGIGIVYSPERSSMFVVNNEDYENIIEIAIGGENQGEILNEDYEIAVWFFRRSSHITSLGWYPEDEDGMPLYIFEVEFEDDFNGYRILKLNPDNSGWKLVTEITEGIDDVRWAYGCSILPDHESGNLAIAWTEQRGSGRSPADSLVIRSLGPNVSFLSPGSFRNKSGIIAAGEDITIGFEINADGWEVGDYTWSYFVNHNGFGDGLVIPCTLTVDATSNMGDVDPSLPVEFGLHAIYPNPFNSMTRISFGIPNSAFTELKVYDLSGREVEMLLSSEPSVGNHTLTWDATGLASGVYLLRLESAGMTRARKVVLMK